MIPGRGFFDGVMVIRTCDWGYFVKSRQSWALKALCEQHSTTERHQAVLDAK